MDYFGNWHRSVIGTLLLTIACFGQETAPIQVKVRLVNVTVMVRDASGGAVTDLTKDDFEILEDGQPQTITFFARSSELPLALGLAVDSSGSQKRFFKDHQKDVMTFLRNVMTPRDQAFLLTFGNRLRLASDFTSSAAELMEAYQASQDGSRRRHGVGHGGSPLEIGPPEIRVLGTAFYDAIFHAASDMLGKVQSGRRGMVIFSDGEDNSSAHHMLDAIEAAQTHNVPLFAVRYTEVKEDRLNARNKYGISVMRRLAEETGGAEFDARSTDLKKAFLAIAEQLRSSYELAYYPTGASDATFHKLVIRTRRPGLTVRAKSGYYSRD
jgi:Ca-activated chloride channel family protein